MPIRSFRLRRGAAICALAMMLAQVAAAAADAGPLARSSLGRALEQAWRLHPEAAALEDREAGARAAQELAGGLTPEPGSVSIGSRNDRANRNLGQQEYEVELAAPLWLPGQQAAREAAAASLVDAVAAQRAALRWELAGQLREAWWQLAAARNARVLTTRRLDTARALANDVRRRHAAGDLSRIDANLAQSEVLAADAELLEADVTLLQAEQALQVLTGAPLPALIDEEVLVSQASAGTLRAAPESHPQLAAAAASARSSRARVQVAAESPRAAPELALRVVRERGDFAQPYSSSVGVRLKIPFSAGAQVRRESAAVQADASQAEAEMLRARSRVQLAAESAQRALRAAEQQLAMARERRALAADTLRLAEKAFMLGESDLATLLRIRAAAFDAEAFHDRQRVARAAAISRLNQALGALP